MEQYKIIQNTKNKKKLGNDFEAKDVWLSKVGNKRLIKFKVHILAYNDYRILEFPNNNENGKELTILNDQDVSGKFNEIRIPPNMKSIRHKTRAANITRRKPNTTAKQYHSP